MLISNIIIDWFNNAFHMLLLWLDSIVYFFVSIIYQLFIYLSTARIFEDAFFADFANRIYAILGVFMLFYLAYALLNALVDPEKLAKGDKSVAKLAQNLIISLVLLGLLPSVFTYAYRLQNYILSSNLIGALIMGTKPNTLSDNNQAMIKFGDTLSFTVLNAFINPTNENVNMSTNYNWYDFKKSVLENSDYSSLPALSDGVTKGAPIAGSGSGSNVKVVYYAFFSTAAGCYLIYVLLSFTLDLGVRIIKLAFCQLIAPIPIILRAMPSKKGTFDKWLKLTLSVYFEVFIRVGIMYMSVYFIKALADNQIITNFIKDGVMGMFALIVVILGIFTFAKQAPKLISETLGIDSANLKLGIGEKLKASGFLGNAINNGGQRLLGMTTGAIGAGWSSIVNGAGPAGFLFGAANGWKNKGFQFNKQRQELYTKVTGDFKGKAGIFGGSSLGTKISNYMTGLPVAESSRRRQELMKEFEDTLLEVKKQEFKKQQSMELELLRNSFDEKKKLFDEKKQEELATLENKYNKEKQLFENNKNEKINNLNTEYIKAKSNNDILNMSRIDKELKNEENSSYKNESLSQSIENIRKQDFSVTKEAVEIQNKIQSISRGSFNETTVRQEIHEEYNKNLDKLDSDYKEHRADKERLLTNRAAKKYHANVVNADRLGEVKATNQQKEAFQKVLEELGYKKDDKK